MKTLFCGWHIKHDPHIIDFLNSMSYQCEGYDDHA